MQFFRNAPGALTSALLWHSISVLKWAQLRAGFLVPSVAVQSHFSRCPRGPLQRAASGLWAQNFGLAAHTGLTRFSVPRIAVHGIVLGRPGGPTSSLPRSTQFQPQSGRRCCSVLRGPQFWGPQFQFGSVLVIFYPNYS